MQTIDELVRHFLREEGTHRLTPEQLEWLIAEGTVTPWLLWDDWDEWCEDCQLWECHCGNYRDVEESRFEDGVYWHFENLDRLALARRGHRRTSGMKRRPLTINEAIEKLNHRFLLWSRTAERLDRLVRVARLLGKQLDWQETAIFLREQNPEELARELRARYRRRSLKSLLTQLHDMDLALAGLTKNWRGPVAASIRSIVCKAPQDHELYRYNAIATVGRLSRVSKHLQHVRAIDMRRLQDQPQSR